ncbi:hypothetical protein GCM10010869_20950 [Mesorhizobium tianshanense]|nr:hypothetical protein GCM10010869_20950 [Mesorhizobium tianshanense]
MDENERVSRAVRNERRRDNRLAKRGCRGKHAIVVGSESIECLRLRPSQLALEGNDRRKCRADFTTILQIGNGAMALDEIDHLIETASG